MDALDEIRNAMAGASTRQEKARCIADLVRARGGYRWVGVYEVAAGEVRAVGWTGDQAPAHPTFPVSQGLCGTAVRARETVVVPDVRNDPRYLATFGSTRSEIVVPVFAAGLRDVLGLIDVESDRANAFTARDRATLEHWASALTSLWPELV